MSTDPFYASGSANVNGRTAIGESADRPRLLIPTILIALDPHGEEVCKRLASLLRTRLRDPHDSDTQSMRDRFGFIRMIDTPALSSLTGLLAVAFDPSARLWDIAESNWQYRLFAEAQPLAFTETLRQLASRVLDYRLVEEQLRDRQIVIQPSQLNVFFVGALFPEELPPTGAPLTNPAADPPDPPVPTMLAERVRRRLEELGKVAESVRSFAGESTGLDLVVRGAFLSLALPEDSYVLARDSLQRYAGALSRLLTPQPISELSNHNQSSDQETLLHFCSLYSNYDAQGAWYNPRQLVNTTASAIFALLMSELFDNSTCAAQLGLYDPYVGPYERLITVAAVRSSAAYADLLDYTALQYGAYLLEALQLDPTGMLGGGNRKTLKDLASRLFNKADLAAIVERDDNRLYNRHGEPIQLSRLASAAFDSMDLQRLIPYPRIPWLFGRTSSLSRAMAELERLDRLSVYLDSPLVDELDQSAVELQNLEGSGTFTYDQEPILFEWKRWQDALAAQIDHPEHGEVMRHILPVAHEVSRALWDQPPNDIALNPMQYAIEFLTQTEAGLREVQSSLRQRVTIEQPDSAINLLQAQQRVQARGLSILVAQSLMMLPLLVYLFVGISANAATSGFANLLRQTFSFSVFNTSLIIRLPMTLSMASILTAVLIMAGVAIRQVQKLNSAKDLRIYAQLVRMKYANAMYRYEQGQIERLLEGCIKYTQLLRRWAQDIGTAVQGAAETLRSRADELSVDGFRDISEYLIIARRGSEELYRNQIKPKLASYAESDLPRLRRGGRQVCTLNHLPPLTSAFSTQQQAAEQIRRLILRDEQSEDASGDSLRLLAYDAIQKNFRDVVRTNMAHLSQQQGYELQQRVHSMLRLGSHPHMNASSQLIPFQQNYFVIHTEQADESLELNETIMVRGLDDQNVIYVRIISRIWPRLFESAEVKL